MSTTNSPVPSLLDLVDRDPYDSYQRMRDAGDVVWDEGIHAWVAASYVAAKESYNEDKFSKMSTSHPSPGERYAVAGSELSVYSGVERARMRQWWLRIFAPKSVEAWRSGLVQPVVNASIDRFAARGRAELAEDYARQIPVRVIAAILGLPWKDDEWIAEWQRSSDDVQNYYDAANYSAGEVTAERAIVATRKMNALLTPFVEERRSGQGDDLISKTWRDGPQLLDRWDAEDVLATARLFFFAGSHSTTLTLCNALYVIVTHRILAEQLRSGDSKLVVNFVEEALRRDGMVQFRPRIALTDTEIAGVPIASGQTIAAVIASANRDPAHYSCPADIDLRRKTPRDHLAFGAGAGICLGAALARAELQEGVSAVLRRLPDLRLDPEAESPKFMGFVFKFYSPLHVLFSRTAG